MHHQTIPTEAGSSENKAGPPPELIGSSFILPLDLKKSRGTKTIPISGLSHKPIGQLKCNFLS